MTSCAGFKEAYNDRICFDATSNMPIQCKQVFVDFKCNETITLPASALPKLSKTISTKLARNYVSPKVGELFSQHGNIPIFVKNKSPFLTLKNDIDKLLIQAGYKIVHDSEGIANVLVIDIQLLDVRFEEAGWTSLKGVTKATVSFKVTLINNTGVTVWSDEFSTSDNEMVDYALLSDSEKLLNSSYCKSLKKFSEVIYKESFYKNVQ